MKGAVVEITAARNSPLNAVSLKNAVLCAECDVVSDSPHDQCLVCGSRSLFSISRLLGGMMPKQRARLVADALAASAPVQPRAVAQFPRTHRVRTRDRQVRTEPWTAEKQLGLYGHPRS